MRTKLMMAVIAVSGVGLVMSCSGGNDMMMMMGFDKWEGDTPHLHVEGTVKGTKVSINLTGADAMDTAKLYCKREYFADPNDAGMLDLSTATPSEVKIIWNIGSGQDGYEVAELEIKRHDFRANAKDDKVTFVTRNDAMQPTGQNAWLEIQKNTPDAGIAAAPKVLEYGAASGTYTHGEYECTRDATNMALCSTADKGKMGGFIDGTWTDTDKLKASWTAICIKDAPEARVQ